jgi:small-conductance mechanosensitive channel
MRRASLVPALLIAGLTAFGASAAAQPAQNAVEATLAAAAEQSVVEAGPGVTLSYANRPIVTLRASVFGRPAAERASGARAAIDRLVADGILGPVGNRSVASSFMLTVGGRDVFGLVPTDVDPLAGETLAETAARATSQLQTALDEVGELRRPRQLLSGALQVLLVTALFVGVVWLLLKARTRTARWIREAAKRRLHARVADEEFVRLSRIAELLDRLVALVVWGVALFVGYWWLTFSLRRFPYTRPWGESLRAFILTRLSHVGAAMIDALPELFTVALIFLLTRFASRLVQLLFHGIQGGRISVPFIYPETAEPTRKLLTVGLWLFAIAIAYPYLPGSESEAFKGVSVFVGLIVSLGSSGLVNQVMSGFTLTYSRALRKGDFVAIGDVEGVVTQVGTLSTKVTTIGHEDVTIPNAVVVSQIVTNYSRFADSEGVFVPTNVTIGYDVPWRQVEALLLLAAARTPGIRKKPAPRVRQAELQDAYVKYTLLFCPEDPAERRIVLAAVHANILDAFNEYGVQITSPNYEADPERPKIVPRERWFAAPAVPQAEAAFSAAAAAPPSQAPHE